MMLPFLYSFKDALRDILGVTLYNMIPQASIRELGEYFIVDTPGILAWTAIFLLLGIIIGRATK